MSPYFEGDLEFLVFPKQHRYLWFLKLIFWAFAMLLMAEN